MCGCVCVVNFWPFDINCVFWCHCGSFVVCHLLNNSCFSCLNLPLLELWWYSFVFSLHLHLLHLSSISDTYHCKMCCLVSYSWCCWCLWRYALFFLSLSTYLWGQFKGKTVFVLLGKNQNFSLILGFLFLYIFWFWFFWGFILIICKQDSIYVFVCYSEQTCWNFSIIFNNYFEFL